MAVPKTALVAGSTSAIGAALSMLLAGRGFDLTLLNRNQASTAEQARELRRLAPGIEVRTYQADLSDRAQLLAAIAAILDEAPAIDLVFYNAGVLLPEKHFSPQGNEMHFELHTLVPYIMMHLLRPAMAAPGNASFVVSGSGARRMARSLDVPGLPNPASFRKMSGPYAQSKQAIAVAAHVMAADFERDGIALRVVDLPPTRTAMAQGEGMPPVMKTLRFLFASPGKSARRLFDAAMQPGTSAKARAAAMPPEPVRRQLLELLVSKAGLG